MTGMADKKVRTVYYSEEFKRFFATIEIAKKIMKEVEL